jgi:hypothetical protein
MRPLSQPGSILLHTGSVEVSPQRAKLPTVSIPCVGDNLAGWVALDGIDPRYRVAVHPVSLPHVVQFRSLPQGVVL